MLFDFSQDALKKKDQENIKIDKSDQILNSSNANSNMLQNSEYNSEQNLGRNSGQKTPSNSEEGIFSFNDIQDEVLLSRVEGIGPMLTERLLEHFGDAKSILSASRTELEQVAGIGSQLSRQIVSARQNTDLEKLFTLCEKNNISILVRKDRRYPKKLLEIHDPPPVLYLQGTLMPCDEIAIAVVGTRRTSLYGKTQAERLSQGLAAAGFTVVSGLALGIDGYAHQAALRAQGRTIGVLGSGLLQFFPKEHLPLAGKIIESGGAVLSEFHPEMPPMKGNFPQRNRIVCGLSLGVLVVEAPQRSGALITARLATEENREVFAVPGPVDHENSSGCHRLIRDGATLVESVDDILEQLGPLSRPTVHSSVPAPVHHPAELLLNEREAAVLAQIHSSSTPIDQVIEQCSLQTHQVLGIIAALEFRKLIRREEGNSVRRL